jgi:hypothetical protein
VNEKQKQQLDTLSRSINAEATARGAEYLPLIRQRKDSSWIDGFLSFRDDFEFADASQEVMAAFAGLRLEHQEPAKKAFGEARKLFQQGRQDEGYAKYQEIVEKYYASSLYRNVKRWLQERK